MTEKKVLNKILKKIRQNKPLNKYELEIRHSKAYRKDFNKLLKGGV